MVVIDYRENVFYRASRIQDWHFWDCVCLYGIQKKLEEIKMEELVYFGAGVFVGLLYGIIIWYDHKKARNWKRLEKWIRAHREKGKASFNVSTDEDTFVITVKDCEQSHESWVTNMLRIHY